MRVGPLPNGHVLLTLDAEQIAAVRAVAEQRESVPRHGEKGARAATGRKTHLEGAACEMAVASFYGAQWISAGVHGTDGGIDFALGSFTAQVKSRAHSPHYRIGHLQVSKHDQMTARFFFQCITQIDDDVDDFTVVLVGYCTREKIEAQPIVEVESRKYKNFVGRRVHESELTLISPNAIMSALNRHHRDDAPPVMLAWSEPPDPDEEAHLAALLRVMDIEGGVEVNGRRGTLISALSSNPRMPPGCQIVFQDEREIARNSITRNNPMGRPIARNFHPHEVKIV